MNFNKVIIVGNLTRDPEGRTLPSGQPVTNFGVATNRFYNDKSGNRQQVVEFHNVVAFGKLAEICSQYLKKGSLVLIEGRLQTRSWQAQDETQRQRTEIVTEAVQLGPRRQGEFAQNGPPAEDKQKPAGDEQTPNETTKQDDDIPVIDADEEEKGSVNPEDIPF